MVKICNKCNLEKDIENFYKGRNACKVCIIEKSKISSKKNYLENKDIIKDRQQNYYIKNKDMIKEREKKYHINNKDKRKQTRNNYYKENKNIINQRNKEWYDKNKDSVAIRKKDIYTINSVEINKDRYKKRKERQSIDPIYQCLISIKGLIYKSIKKKCYTKNSRTYEILSCTFEEFKIYIENQFEDWMTWDNHGTYTGNYNETWQYDHIIAISNASNEEEVIKLNHYTNFRPLCSRKNLEKGKKIDID